MLKIYHHLPMYLHRWQLFCFGNFAVRIHRILSPDQTPFVHTHPFHYMSVVLRGGYTEQVLVNDTIKVKTHSAGSVIPRTNNTYHRILCVKPNTVTLFFVWKTTRVGQGWALRRHPQIDTPAEYINDPDGLYDVGTGFRKRHDGKWFALRPSVGQAAACNTLSIHQSLRSKERQRIKTIMF